MITTPARFLWKLLAQWPLVLFSMSAPAALGEIPLHLPQARHDLHFTNVVTRWDEALPLGAGLLGALVWGDGQPLKISLDRTDLWDLTPVPEFQGPDYNLDTVLRWRRQGRHQDLVKLLEDPYNRPAPTRIPAGRIQLDLGTAGAVVESSLQLRTATARVRCAGGATIEVLVHATHPIGLIRIRGLKGVQPRLVAPAFGGTVRNPAAGGIGAGDLSQLNYPPPQEQRESTAQSFLQKGALGFSFAAALEWQERDGEWVGAWSVASSFEGDDPLQMARRRVSTALEQSMEDWIQSHQRWWESYWQKSSLSLPNPILERQWFLETYKFGAASRRGAPPISLQGPWTADDGQLPPWKGDYHHDLNTQLSYWPCYSGNRLEEGLSYLDWLWATRSNCVAWTRRFFNLPGLNVPMTSDLANQQIGGWRQYTHSFTTAAWLAQHFYLHWKYSGDLQFLRDRAWPYLREASVFIEAASAPREPGAKRTLPLSSSPEIHDNRPEAWFENITNYDLALVRWLTGATAELAETLQLSEEAARWRRVCSEFPALALSQQGVLLVAPDAPLRESHRHFSHLMAMHPLGLLDVRDGSEAERIVRASLRDLEQLGTAFWCGYSFAWLGNLAARAGDGAGAERALEIFARAFTLRNSFHCNGDQSGKGYSTMTYRPFTLEGNFAAAAGVQEMLLQSHRGVIEVFPAIPDAWQDVAFRSLRAQGAFLVSAARRGGIVRELEVLAERDGTCRLKSPWSGRELKLTMRAGERKVWTSDPAIGPGPQNQ